MPDNGQDGLPGRVRQRANAEVMRRSPCCVAWPVTESSWHQVQAEPEPVAIHHLALPGKEQSVPPATLRWPAGRGRNRHGCPQWPLPRRRTLLPLVADLSQPATNYRQTRRIVVNASRFSRTSQPLTNLPMPSRPSDCFEVAMKSSPKRQALQDRVSPSAGLRRNSSLHLTGVRRRCCNFPPQSG